jgi:Cu-Zn family superoxide dismutase
MDMRNRHVMALAGSVLVLAACGQKDNGHNQASADANVAANAASGPIEEAPAVPLVDGTGKVIGHVLGGDSDQGAVFKIEASGLTPGVHGIHIHAVGKCEGPKFESAGGHWNPTNAEHGMDDAKGPHLGDIPNITVGPDGKFSGSVTVANGYLVESKLRNGPGQQILDGDGAALVIHAKADDYKTQPSGDSGDRIACAVLGSGAANGVNPQ